MIASDNNCMIPKSLSCMCCRESSVKNQQPQYHNNIRHSWEYTLMSQPLPLLPIKVEHLSLQQLETQVRELNQRLQHAESDRNNLQQQLEECNAEKDLCLRRLEVISTAHDCRITEMHCVIAELSKKLRAKQDNTILEEQEPEGSEISYQEGSIYNSELNLTNPDAECQTDPLEAGDYSVGDDNMLCNEVTEEIKVHNEGFYKGQAEALQEEILHLKAEIALLQSEIADSKALVSSEIIREEEQNIEYFGEDVEANDGNCLAEQLQFEHGNYKAQTAISKLAPKMAERVKLRSSKKLENDSVTATDLFKSELKNADIVEHLVADLKLNNSMLDSFVEPAQLDNELQRLSRRIDHLKVRNTILSLTLDECRENNEHLYLLCGKYESNAIALQIALNCSDRAIEAYDVMLALLESKMVLMQEKTIASDDSRAAVESVARHLLDRLESEKNICENSLGPWQNSFSIPEKVCAPWTSEDDNRLRYHVSKLKGRRASVQNTMVTLESPFSDAYERLRMERNHKEQQTTAQNQDKKLNQADLEMAVLLQELLNLREENISLKTKMEDAEREKQYANDRIDIQQEALKQLQLQLQLSADTNSLFQYDENRKSENRVSYTEAEHAALTEQQLVEALTRESELKARIQTLIASVSNTQKTSNEKYEQLHQSVKDLQKSNVSLGQLLEQNKRKYQTRIRKLEHKLMEMSAAAGHHHNIEDINELLAQPPPPPQRMRGKSLAANAKTQNNVPETTL